MKARSDAERFARYQAIVDALLAKEYLHKADLYPSFKPEEKMLIGRITDYVRLYAFLSQILTFTDPDLEKVYVFSRLLRRYLSPERDHLPREIQQNIDMENFRVQQTWKGKIKLERGNGEVEPIAQRRSTDLVLMRLSPSPK